MPGQVDFTFLAGQDGALPQLPSSLSQQPLGKGAILQPDIVWLSLPFRFEASLEVQSSSEAIRIALANKLLLAYESKMLVFYKIRGNAA